MSRPPIPHPAESTGREQVGDLARLDYLPLEYADLLALQDELAVRRLGRPHPQVRGEVDEADVARTFMELSALVGHVLATYQRRYAGEAYISTARAASSLVRHARRLAYDPDPGLAAGGYVVLFAKDGVSGTVAAGLPLSSVPLGEIKAQDYETGEDLAVDAALNELEPLHAGKPAELVAGARRLRLDGIGLGIEAAAHVVLLGVVGIDPALPPGTPLGQGFVVDAVAEDAEQGVTTIHLDRPLGASLRVDPDDPPVLLAHPALELRQFGDGADPSLYPPSAIVAAGPAERKASPSWHYTVQRPDGLGYDALDIYLSEQLAKPLVGQPLLRKTGPDLRVLRVTGETDAAVIVERTAQETLVLHKLRLVAEGDGFQSERTPENVTQPSRSRISGTVTAIRASDWAGAAVTRSTLTLPALWLGGWATRAQLAVREPNPAPLKPAAEQPLELPGQLTGLTPGRPLIFSDRAGSVAQIVTVNVAEVDAENDVTKVTWDASGPAPLADGWRLDDLKVHGNVARVSHGRTVHESLGGSDGVTAFQRFELRQSPLTIVPGAAGGEPELAVRVDDILWQRVRDFAASGPDDRHYRSETGEDGVTTVVFGDGRNGAVPSSGDKNVRATYRVGLGRAGDVEPRRLSRLKRAHPLLARVVNLTPISGGAEPAEPDAIRSQSTRWIRTFDRAVSVADHADLALTMPGIARAAARWDQSRGVLLVLATAEGEAPSTPDAVRAFLDARRDTTVPLEVLDPKPRELRIIVDVEPDPAYLVQLVEDAVRAALHGESRDAPGMFTFAARGLGQPAYLSEVYERLESLPGVVGVRVRLFASSTRAVMDVIPADVDEWLHLPPNRLSVTIVGSPT